MTRSRDQGFSLIELMIVVGLAAVLAGMSVPAIAAAMDRYAVISASQSVVSTIRSARLQAVARNMVLKVRMDFPAEGQYQIVDAADAEVGGIQTLDDGITFGAFTDVEFSTAGRLAAPITVTVTNGHEEHDRTISVSASGQVRLQQ